MEIQIYKLRESLELLKPAVARKPTIKSLGYVMLKDGQAVATDLETMVIVPMPEADITALMPIKDVAKVLQYVPGTERLNVKATKKKLSMSWSDGSASFPIEDPETFPEIPEFNPVAEETLSSDILIPGLVALQSYAATETSRPILSGVTLILGDPIRIAAGDGYRMADKELPLTFPMEFTTILPSSSVSVLSHLWKKVPRTPPSSDALVPILTAKKMVTVAHDGEKGLRFQFSKNATAIVKLIAGDPPDWLKLIPTGEPILKVHAYAPDLELALNRVKSIAYVGSDRVRMDFKENEALISAKGEDLDVESSIETLNAEGVPNRFAINVSYLLNYLKDKDGIVSIAWAGGNSPITFQSANNPRVLIMPMKYE